MTTNINGISYEYRSYPSNIEAWQEDGQGERISIQWDAICPDDQIVEEFEDWQSYIDDMEGNDALTDTEARLIAHCWGPKLSDFWQTGSV